MRLCVVSDSHRRREALRLLAAEEETCDAFVHLGDLTADAEYLRELTGRPVYSVRGNCDLGSRLPDELTLEEEGARLLLCHGHERRVKEGLYPLLLRAREAGVQAALFGHTHAPLCEWEQGILLLNPGALRDGRYARLVIERGTLSPSLTRLAGL